MEAGDRDLAAAGRRELLEETGITECAGCLDTGIDFRFRKDAAEILERVIGIEVDGPCPVTLSSEHVGYEWLAPSEALGRLAWETNREGLRHILDHVEE